MKTLFVGDVHTRSEDIEDCRSLMELVYETAKTNNVDGIVFLGDQHHNHAIVHVEAIAFWKEAFTKLGTLGKPIHALVGNHDMPGDTGSDSHAMLAYDGIVNTKEGVFGDFLFVNYKHSKDDFLKTCQLSPDSILVCHATFQGAQYENGFYAQDGIEQDLVPNKNIISGHIHLHSNFGKVFYPGSPRWITASDANEDKFIWMVETSEGNIVNKAPISTGEYCSRIIKLEDTEENPVTIKASKKDKLLIHIKGTQQYIDSRLGKFFGKAQITTQCLDSLIPSLRASEGIDRAILKALDAYEPKYVSIDKLRRTINDRLIQAR
jgi:DNA repair exonuclease SbcCD nuclease subunit